LVAGIGAEDKGVSWGMLNLVGFVEGLRGLRGSDSGQYYILELYHYGFDKGVRLSILFIIFAVKFNK